MPKTALKLKETKVLLLFLDLEFAGGSGLRVPGPPWPAPLPPESWC